ncbi:hypothetical protein [Nocardia camponoti]|uniref:Uncharacterized protein n=1 Tax=Nocardia camponoti TaxID=1616106 RepID=A0A917V3N6_9NOCA|nr:hypothetical protein [Nocardia camponoti]GGK35208.1 hypothetical protein GCM10011591_03600 [Nocardia camponoti]
MGHTGAATTEPDEPYVPLPRHTSTHLELVTPATEPSPATEPAETADEPATPLNHAGFPSIGETSHLTTAARHRLAAYIHTKLAELAEMP